MKMNAKKPRDLESLKLPHGVILPIELDPLDSLSAILISMIIIPYKSDPPTWGIQKLELIRKIPNFFGCAKKDPLSIEHLTLEVPRDYDFFYVSEQNSREVLPTHSSYEKFCKLISEAVSR